jgi:hypothetical protein
VKGASLKNASRNERQCIAAWLDGLRKPDILFVTQCEKGRSPIQDWAPAFKYAFLPTNVFVLRQTPL